MLFSWLQGEGAWEVLGSRAQDGSGMRRNRPGRTPRGSYFAPGRSWSSDQRMLWRSWGQVTVFFSQSMRKFATSKPSSALACQVLSL